MSKIDDGGPAFPLSAHPSHGYGPGVSVEAGMSRRQWLVGLAMQPLISIFLKEQGGGYWKQQHAAISKEAHQLADSILAFERAEAEEKK